MAVVVGGQEALVGGLAAVVQFLHHPVPQLGSSASTSWAGRGDPQHPAQQRDVAQIGRDGLGDARVLDLDGNARPSRVTARCTCPIEAAAIGTGSQRANARSGGSPSSS
jgi:hypothetical protein